MKRALSVLTILLIAALCLTGCFGAGTNTTSSEPAEPLNPSLPPDGFSFEVPEGYKMEQLSETSVQYQGGGNRIVYSFSHVPPEVVETFGEAVGSAELAQFAEQYAMGMESYEPSAVGFLSRNGLRLSAPPLASTPTETAAPDVLLVLPLDRHILQFEYYGPDADQLANELITGAAYDPPAAEESPSGEESAQS